MKVLITGANGLLGQKLVQLLNQQSQVEVIATGRGVDRNAQGSHQYHTMDVTSSSEVNEIFDKVVPDYVVNTAAMTNVDQCETEKEACWAQNVSAVSYLIDACGRHQTAMIHLSTDFIFDGEHGPYLEDAEPKPISYYGESKLASEQLLLNSQIHYAILRTVLVYGIVHDMSRSNIILWVKKSLEEGKEIKVVNDQWRTPTLAEDLAIGCQLAIEKKAKGIFNISGKDFLTPYEMAVATADFFGLDTKTMTESDGSIFKQPAKRPPRTGFILTKAEEELGYHPRSFKEGLAILNQQLSEFGK